MRILEMSLLAHVVIGFLAAFLAWRLWMRGQTLAPILFGALVAWLFSLDALRFSALGSLRALAHDGAITSGRVVGFRRIRFTRALRADGAFPRGGLPFIAGLEVRYSFEDDAGRTYAGHFLTRRSDAPIYVEGRALEVFFLPGDPARNAASIVLRWYFRLAGSELVEEAPSADFPGDDKVEVEWWD